MPSGRRAGSGRLVRPAIRLGFHLSISGGLLKAVDQARRLGLGCLQIFAGNPRGWKRTPLDPDMARQFRQAVAQADLDPVVIHAPYLINLASPQKGLWSKSIKLLAHELVRAQDLGATAVVVHPGGRGDRPLDWGLDRVAVGAGRALDQAGVGAQLWLENTAGGGGQLGGTLDQLRELLDRLAGRPMGICLDTAHAWAAGYRLDSPAGVDSFLDQVERVLGLEAVKLWHFNDIDMPVGSRRDRHQHLGKGRLGRKCFAALLADPRLGSARVIMETPKDSPRADQRNLAYLRRLLPGSPQGSG